MNEDEQFKTILSGLYGIPIILFTLAGISYIQQKLNPQPIEHIPIATCTSTGYFMFWFLYILISFSIGAVTYTVYRLVKKRYIK